MKSRYICRYHAEQIKALESKALISWSGTMNRGVKAYTQCRIEAAEIYLESALDIALLRSECENNGIFTSIHIEKPVEFLVEINLSEHNFDSANRILQKVTCGIPENSDLYSISLDRFLIRQYQRVERLEGDYFCRKANSRNTTSSNTTKSGLEHDLQALN